MTQKVFYAGQSPIGSKSQKWNLKSAVLFPNPVLFINILLPAPHFMLKKNPLYLNSLISHWRDQKGHI